MAPAMHAAYPRLDLTAAQNAGASAAAIWADARLPGPHGHCGRPGRLSPEQLLSAPLTGLGSGQHGAGASSGHRHVGGPWAQSSTPLCRHHSCPTQGMLATDFLHQLCAHQCDRRVHTRMAAQLLSQVPNVNSRMVAIRSMAFAIQKSPLARSTATPQVRVPSSYWVLGLAGYPLLSSIPLTCCMPSTGVCSPGSAVCADPNAATNRRLKASLLPSLQVQEAPK